MNSSEPETEHWSLLHRIALRFTFVYLVLYAFPFPLYYIPGLTWSTQAYERLWHVAVPWVGTHLLNITITVFPNGSGDTTYNYVQVLCYAALAATATAAWSLLAARRRAHPLLRDWLRVYVRYVLATVIIGYGMAKVLNTQFSFPSPGRLEQRFGQSSPMGLLWTFMGYSTVYTTFAGSMEVLGGMLLFWRRTTTAGALVVSAVMANVVMLNLCYDVPVKLLSMHLLVMAVYLLLPDIGRLANMLVLNRPVPSASLGRPFSGRWTRITGFALKATFIAGFLLWRANYSWNLWLEYGNRGSTANARGPFDGTYEVTRFTRNGVQTMPSTEDGRQWRRVLISQHDGLAIQMTDNTIRKFQVVIDSSKRTLDLTSRKDDNEKVLLTYSQSASDEFVLTGGFLGEAISAGIRRLPDSPQSSDASFPLVTRGFHWINEFPYNR